MYETACALSMEKYLRIDPISSVLLQISREVRALTVLWSGISAVEVTENAAH